MTNGPGGDYYSPGASYNLELEPMNKVTDKIVETVITLLDKAATSSRSEDAMRYSQAAQNAANIYNSLQLSK